MSVFHSVLIAIMAYYIFDSALMAFGFWWLWVLIDILTGVGEE